MFGRPAWYAVTGLALAVAAPGGCRCSRRDQEPAQSASAPAAQTESAGTRPPAVPMARLQVARPVLATNPAWVRITAAWREARELIASPAARTDPARRQRVLDALTEAGRDADSLLLTRAINRKDGDLVRVGTDLLASAVQDQAAPIRATGAGREPVPSPAGSAIARLTAQMPQLQDLLASLNLDLTVVAGVLPLLAQDIATAERDLAILPESERASAQATIDAAKAVIANLQGRLPSAAPRFINRGASGY